jgi:hypothetical protein
VRAKARPTEALLGLVASGATQDFAFSHIPGTASRALHFAFIEWRNRLKLDNFFP